MSFEVSETGVWLCDRHAHTFDEPLANALVSFLENEHADAVLDVGCGTGDYVSLLLAKGFKARGIDGNPLTSEFFPSCECRELTKAWDVSAADWILCLEVAEHIPPQHENNFLDQLTQHANKGVVLSWFPEHGHGIGHFNPRPNDYVKERMAEREFHADDAAAESLRRASTLWWFSGSLQVFRRL